MNRVSSIVLSIASAASLLLAGAGSTLAGSVDPDTLQPPPPAGARCFEAGNQVICDTTLNFYPVNEPFFDAPCGTVYLTGTDLRDGFRFYTDGKMTRRHVTATFNGTLTLSPTGDGPYLTVTGYSNWWTVWPIPGGGDEDGLTTESGLDLRLSGPGIASRFQIAGHFLPDGTTHGLLTGFSDESLALVCEALGA